MTNNRITEDRESSPPPDEEPEDQQQENQNIISQDNDEDRDETDEFVSPEVYEQLDAQLDDLNLVLDMMEQKNDHIREEFLKLLHSNKQIREELQQENQNTDSNEQMEE